MSNENPTPAVVLAGLGHAIASVYTLAAQVLEPDWADWTAEERATAIDGPVQHLRALAPHLEKLHGEAGPTTLQQALYLARAQVHADDGIVGNALAMARAGAVLNHWLRTLAGLHCQNAAGGPLTLGELFQRVQRTSQAPRQRIAVEEQTKQRALETSAHCLIESAAELADQALGLLWLHGSQSGQTTSHLGETAANLFTQASGVLLCASGFFSNAPHAVPEIEDNDVGNQAQADHV